MELQQLLFSLQTISHICCSIKVSAQTYQCFLKTVKFEFELTCCEISNLCHPFTRQIRSGLLWVLSNLLDLLLLLHHHLLLRSARRVLHLLHRLLLELDLRGHLIHGNALAARCRVHAPLLREFLLKSQQTVYTYRVQED